MRLAKKNTNDRRIESKILTGFITSTQFCNTILPIMRFEYFVVSHIRKIVRWIRDYHGKYTEAPNLHIKDLFEVEKENLEDAETDLIELYLVGLSELYENREEDQLNVNYLIDETRDYFKRRSLKILFDKGNSLVEIGRIDEADKLLSQHSGVAIEVSALFNPFDVEEIRSYDIENIENRLFRFPGAIGKLFGWFERDWLVAVTAPEKRGKTWILEELVFQALSHRLKVVWFSAEINKYILKDRIYRRLVAKPKEDKRWVVYPVFDCGKNQDDTCKRMERKNRCGLEDREKNISGYMKSHSKTYSVCTCCRDRKSKDYQTAYWFARQRKTGKASIPGIEKKAKSFVKMYGGNLRVEAFPKFSVGLDTIKTRLDFLEETGFVADIVVVDYFDVLAEEKKIHSERGNIDAIWKKGANIAGTRHCLVVTADQSSKFSRTRKSLRNTDTTEDKRKDAHLDVRIALNQTDDEKDDGVMRVSTIYHRSKEYNVNREVMILQSLDLAQPMLDSEFMRGEEKKKE